MRATALALMIIASTAGAASAEPCVTAGGNRPAIDGNPAVRIDPKAPQMHCDMTVVQRVDARTGRTFQSKTWNFSVR